MEIIERKNGFALVLNYDCDTIDPREWDNVGKLYLKSRRYNICECDESDLEDAMVKLPVYKYEHSGIALSTDNSRYPFNDRFDACVFGYIVAFKDDVKRMLGENANVDEVREALKNEVETFSKYLNGEVYCYAVYKVDDDILDEDVEKYGDWVDSCGGYYDREDAIAEGKDAFCSLVEESIMA